jgi:hypothetical protein
MTSTIAIHSIVWWTGFTALEFITGFVSPMTYFTITGVFWALLLIGYFVSLFVRCVQKDRRDCKNGTGDYAEEPLPVSSPATIIAQAGAMINPDITSERVKCRLLTVVSLSDGNTYVRVSKGAIVWCARGALDDESVRVTWVRRGGSTSCVGWVLRSAIEVC